MKLLNRLMALSALLAITGGSVTLNAQNNAGCNGGCNNGRCQGGIGDGNCGPRPSTPCPEVPPSNDCIGSVGPNGKRYLNPIAATRLSIQDHFSPQSCYAYGPAGLDATRMNHWNGEQAAQYAWHGNYNYWRYGQPTALVVPPTAAFQTEYNWGVAQTRRIPIYHQFGAANGAVAGGGAGSFSNTPYWPSSTSQFGIYPVRGPW
jgi:hypothetical protein